MYSKTGKNVFEVHFSYFQKIIMHKITLVICNQLVWWSWCMYCLCSQTDTVNNNGRSPSELKHSTCIKHILLEIQYVVQESISILTANCRILLHLLLLNSKKSKASSFTQYLLQCDNHNIKPNLVAYAEAQESYSHCDICIVILLGLLLAKRSTICL